MRLQAFIFNWRGHEARAAALQRQLGACCPTVVINSESAAEARHPDWHHVGEDAFFTAQWNAALARLDADVMFHVQADASSRHFAAILERCQQAMQKHRCGVYAPNVDYTSWVFDRGRLTRVDEDLYEVPQTDCTCWAISRDVLTRAPRIDAATNRFGWGIDFFVIGAARSLGLRVLRDYRFTIDHVWRGSGYDVVAAKRQLETALASMPEEVRLRDRELRLEAERKLGRQPWPRRLRENARRLKSSVLGARGA